jgi:hypothetical protein
MEVIMKYTPFILLSAAVGFLALSCGLLDSDPASYTVTFDPDGGIVSPVSISVNAGGVLGNLPIPAGGDGFCGWFTEKKGGGVQLSGTTAINYSSTVYAKWTHDIYIIGILWSSPDVAVCLRNGRVLYTLGGDARIEDITVVGGDVYLAGYRWGTDHNVACYWKNGERTDLGEGIVYAITVFGDNVYTAGSYYNRDIEPLKERPCYWKNGVRFDLANEANEGNAADIAVNGEDVYVVGHYVDNNYLSNFCYWKNGVCTVLESDTAPWGGMREAGSIQVSGNDVYCIRYPGGRGYWKNGIPVLDSFENARTKNIFVLDNDVYVTGHYQSRDYSSGKNNTVACYWKNGEKTDLFRGSPASSFVSSGGSVFTAASRDADNNQIFSYWKNDNLIADSDQIFSYMYEKFHYIYDGRIPGNPSGFYFTPAIPRSIVVTEP